MYANLFRKVMGKVEDVLTKEILMGEGYADAGMAHRILEQLSTSISGLVRLEREDAQLQA